MPEVYGFFVVIFLILGQLMDPQSFGSLEAEHCQSGMSTTRGTLIASNKQSLQSVDVCNIVEGENGDPLVLAFAGNKLYRFPGFLARVFSSPLVRTSNRKHLYTTS